jgi:hypothetical protein
MSIGIGILESSRSGGAFDADAQAFFNRVTAAGGTLSATEQTAINTLVLSLKSNSIWAKMKAIYPMVGSSDASCRQNLKSSSFTGSFSGGWSFTNTGATPNNFNAYMQTSFNPRNEMGNFNHHVSMYSRTQNTSVSGHNLGCYDSVSEITLFQYYSSVSLKGGTAYSYPTNAVTINNTNTKGLQIVSRTLNNSLKLYFNGSLLNTNTNVETALRPNANIFLGSSNFAGNPNQFTPHENSFTSLGDGLNDTESNNLYTAVQAFQTTLSRQV